MDRWSCTRARRATIPTGIRRDFGTAAACAKDFSLAGYIYRSQSTTITQMLYILKPAALPKEQRLADVS
jgi:hypothetical protein